MTEVLNNNMKVLLKSKQGTELKTWIEKNKSRLSNHRIFYILKANLEKGDVYKIGISERGDTSAYGRLNDYYNHMGKSTNENKCLGVKLHLVIANLFNPSVGNNKVRAIETKVIAHLKEAGATERGRERFKISIDKLFDTLDELGVLKGDENGDILKRSPRILDKNEASADTVKAILGHSKNRRGGILFEVSFHRYRKYDSDQNSKVVKQDNREVSYQDLVQLRDGKKLADEYIKKYNL